MRFAALSALLLLPASSWAQSSSSASAAASASASSTASSSSNSTASAAYLQQVLAALTAANLTSLVSVATSIASTSEGGALLASLATGNKTVFAPSNAAFANVSSEVSSNTTLLTEVLSYHILNRTYTAAGIATSPNHTIARTLLKGGNYSLPGNFTAPVVLTKSSDNSTSSAAFTIVQATSNATAMGPAVAANLDVYIIDQVLSLPPSVGDIATSLLPTLASVIETTGLLDPLSTAQGLTIFAPNDAAVAAIESSLGSLNTTQISTILANHVINGTVVYSTELSSGNYTSAAGEAFTFMTNSTGTFVSSGTSMAQIVQSDIIIGNGVVHLIDGVLVNTATDPTAAASAYSSGVAAAATSTEATGAVTATSTAGTASTSGASSSTSKSAGERLAPLSMGFINSVIGGGVALIGAVVGGGLLLL